METFKKIESTNANLDALVKPFSDFDERWALLTSGSGTERENWNTMTVSWGSFGILWNKRIAICYVRPPRHTHIFTKKNELMSLSFFEQNETSKAMLSFCGSKSGRDYDKAAETGLVPLMLDTGCIGFEQAQTILACKKLYTGQIQPDNFNAVSLIAQNYPRRDFHTVYICEIIAAYVRR